MLRYRRDRFRDWSMMGKTTGQLIGVCGLIAEEASCESCVGIGYLFHEAHWGKGYAAESAAYAFRILGLTEVPAQIRPDNAPSRRVAERLGMTVQKRFIRRYRGRNAPLLYSRTIGT